MCGVLRPGMRNCSVLRAAQDSGQWSAKVGSHVPAIESGDQRLSHAENTVCHTILGADSHRTCTHGLFGNGSISVSILSCFVPCPVNLTFMVSSLKMQYNCRPQAEMSASDKQEHCRCCSYTLRCLHLISQRRCNRCRPGLRNTSVISVSWLLAPDSAS